MLLLTVLCWQGQVPALAQQLASRKLILILLYIGCVERNPGPHPDDGARVLKLGTLNAPGLHVLRRTRAGRMVEEGWGDRFQLLTDPNHAQGCAGTYHAGAF